jgi:hypothetical protein
MAAKVTLFPNGRWLVWLVWLACAVCLLAGCPSKTTPVKVGSSPVATSEADSGQLELLKNRSVALLENGAVAGSSETALKMLNEAIEGFRKIARDAPQEVLGTQNLCVALLLQIQQALKPSGDSTSNSVTVNDPANAQAADVALTKVNLEQLEKEFKSSIEQLKRLAPNRPDPWVLESRYFHHIGEMVQSEKSLQQATNKADATADTFFQLIELLQANPAADKSAQVRPLYESAIKLWPSNLALTVGYLETLAKIEDDAAFGSQLAKCVAELAPFRSRTGSPLPKVLDNLQAAYAKKDWKVLRNQSRIIRNVLLVEVAYQNDIYLLRPHTLEYVTLRFDRGVQLPTQQPITGLNFELAPLGIGSSTVTAIAREDIDLDGRDDLVLAADKLVEVWTFTDQNPTRAFSAESQAPINGICLADLDHDFQYRAGSLPTPATPTSIDKKVRPDANLVDTDVDLIAFGSEGIELFENVLSAETKQRKWEKRPVPAEMAGIRGVRGVTAIDFDHDSDLDLVISADAGISLWSNRGDWTFADFSSYSTLPAAPNTGSAVLSFDADRNVLVDMFVGSDRLDAFPVMLANNLHGRYHPRDMNWPKELQGACFAMDAIDSNRDACWDLVSCGPKGVRLLTMKSPGRHSWIPDKLQPLSSTASLGLLTGDFNNDGYTDCLSWGADGLELFAGQSNGDLLKQSDSLKSAGSIIQAVTLDIEDDADEDIISLTKTGQLVLAKNLEGNKNQQLVVVLRADDDGSQRPRERCNMHGVGCLLELKSAGVYQSLIVRGTRTRFGLGQASGAELMRVLWTNGTPNNMFDVKNSSTVFDQQQLNGSCPYIYAWNGQRFEFVTDCLWAAPIGLQFGPGILAPFREWEYLKIDGTALQPKDGRYHLKLTEELWEATYFDTVELMAIDHRADIAVYTNEKVGPAEIAEHRIYTVERPIHPNVIDPQGQDISELVRTRDQRYTKTWRQGINQGLTERHWLEIDLNSHAPAQSAVQSTAANAADAALRQTDEKVLFLTGWIFPTCTSLNLAMAENPQRPESQPPSIQVPDGKGGWAEVIPFTGFPGGKTKTIAIDLKGKFLCDDHRVRLFSNMELCWDEVFYTQGEREPDTSSYRVIPLELRSAELGYRGFSEQRRQPANAPNYYDYNQVTQHSVWAPMSGAFTRYGDVLELLNSADDLQVVMGAGDEMSIEFAVPPEQPEQGWVRDFIIYNVGWDKDADLNTIVGQSVEPLPFRAMKSYPYAPDQAFPDTPAHKEYLRKYQTRVQNPGNFWNQIRDSL